MVYFKKMFSRENFGVIKILKKYGNSIKMEDLKLLNELLVYLIYKLFNYLINDYLFN
jgi:hypothetical protein